MRREEGLGSGSVRVERGRGEALVRDANEEGQSSAARPGEVEGAALGSALMASGVVGASRCGRRSVACGGGVERQRRPGRGACSSGVVMARRSEAAAQRQQAQRARRAAVCALRAQRGERRAREREKREKVRVEKSTA